jgi:hypothetical protein
MVFSYVREKFFHPDRRAHSLVKIIPPKKISTSPVNFAPSPVFPGYRAHPGQVG